MAPLATLAVIFEVEGEASFVKIFVVFLHFLNTL